MYSLRRYQSPSSNIQIGMELWARNLRLFVETATEFGLGGGRIRRKVVPEATDKVSKDDVHQG